jgi:hypothetical protein
VQSIKGIFHGVVFLGNQELGMFFLGAKHSLFTSIRDVDFRRSVVNDQSLMLGICFCVKAVERASGRTGGREKGDPYEQGWLYSVRGEPEAESKGCAGLHRTSEWHHPAHGRGRPW